jgi:hypothetical protein
VMMIWLKAPCSLVGRNQRLEKPAASIFRELLEAASFYETMASADQSTRRLKPKEQRKYRHCRENLKSNKYFSSPRTTACGCEAVRRIQLLRNEQQKNFSRSVRHPQFTAAWSEVRIIQPSCTIIQSSRSSS